MFPLEQFPTSGRRPDGGIRYHYYCIDCKREQGAETRKRIRQDAKRYAREKRRWRERYRKQRETAEHQEYWRRYRSDPEHARQARERERERRADRDAYNAHQRELYCERMARLTPEERRQWREEARLRQWEQRRRAGAAEVPRHNPEPDGAYMLLPVGPFRWWVERLLRHHGDLPSVAVVTGVHQRRLWNVLAGKQPQVALNVVDGALLREGGTFLAELYPELYPDASPEVLYMLRVAADTLDTAEWAAA